MIKKILVSQPKPASDKSPYFDLERKYGVELTFHPFIRIEGVSTREFRDQKVQILDYTAIVFTSRHAIDHFFQLCKDLRVQVPDDMKYFGISESVTLYIQKYVTYRKRKTFFSPSGRFADLVTVMAKHKQERYLFPQSDVQSEESGVLLDQKKLQHKECVMYRTVSNPLSQTELSAYDMVILFTPAGVDSLRESCPDIAQRPCKIACFGRSTAKALTDAGIPVALEAPTVKAPSMAGSLELYLEQQNA